MNDENDKRILGRNHPRADQVQPKKENNNSFVQNGLEHFVSSPKTLLTFILALPVGGIFISGIVAYKSGLHEVDARIAERVPYVQLPNGTTVAGKFQSIDENIAVLKDKAQRCEKVEDDVNKLKIFSGRNR